eukprot:1156659-Pelagomonas_calceolata.AAC.5
MKTCNGQAGRKCCLTHPMPHCPIPPPPHPTYSLEKVRLSGMLSLKMQQTLGMSPRKQRKENGWQAMESRHAPQGLTGLAARPPMPLSLTIVSCRVSPSTEAVGTFLAKSPGTVAGLAVVDLVFSIVDPAVQSKAAGCFLVCAYQQVQAQYTRELKVMGPEQSYCRGDCAQSAVQQPSCCCATNSHPLALTQVSWSTKDGDQVPAGQQLGTVRGLAASILVAERVALNFMQVWHCLSCKRLLPESG